MLNAFNCFDIMRAARVVIWGHLCHPWISLYGKEEEEEEEVGVGVGALLSVEVLDKSAQVVLCSLWKDHTQLGLVKLVMQLGAVMRGIAFAKINDQEIISGVEDQSGFYNMQLGFAAPASGATASTYIPFCSSPSDPMTAATTSDSGLTFNNFRAAMASRKRPRDWDRQLSFLGQDLSSHIQQQILDVDRLILHHVILPLPILLCIERCIISCASDVNSGMDTWQAEKVRVELMEGLQRFLRRILAVVEEGLSKRLKSKEEEIARVSKLHWALEERIKTLCVENQMWRDLARSNEAAAQVLRTNLEQALAEAQVKAEEEAAAITADDAESRCYGDNAGGENRDPAAVEEKRSGLRRVCRCCQAQEPSVLLLPCRHLCVCAVCGPAVVVCPICNCSSNGSVLVNMS
ncbi:hypothetical protein B296_00009259 [Ensete ventricosum]|uniref:RING-type domain-containing protein n=1 Tax=Ensete ventricosum TaxID=4639 RepID=A0A427AQR2_ENSVE|nr:hypothetical protein B296_00009259 [Ensete ventricosum]